MVSKVNKDSSALPRRQRSDSASGTMNVWFENHLYIAATAEAIPRQHYNLGASENMKVMKQ